MLSLFNNSNKRNYTAVFVDYEHWFYSMKHDYHTKPEVAEWMAEIEKDYDVKHWLAFADFNYEEIGREIQILQTAGFQVINSCHNFTYHKKGQTEFSLLNQLYQYTINYPEVKTYILFTKFFPVPRDNACCASIGRSLFFLDHQTFRNHFRKCCMDQLSRNSIFL